MSAKCVLLPLWAILVWPLPAQELLRTYQDTTERSMYGTAAIDIGDIDGDGVPDQAMGGPYVPDIVYVHSGVDGSLIRTHVDSRFNAAYCSHLANVGDVNQDGVPDYLIGSELDAFLHSGQTGDLLHTFHHFSTTEFILGWTVSSAGDVNADGYPDLLIGAPNSEHAVGDYPAPYARVFSGLDYSLLHQVEPPVVNNWFGMSVSDLGDVNADGYDDFLVGSPIERRGTGRVYSGLDATELRRLRGPHAQSQFSYSVSRLEDIDGDGVPDFVVGAPQAGTNEPGEVFVYSGATATLLHDFVGPSDASRFGHFVNNAGDVNGDGFEDILVGAPKGTASILRSGTAYLYSGQDGALIYTFEGQLQGDDFGASVSPAGDVNGDGFDDVLIGATDANVRVGEVYLFAGHDLFLNIQPRILSAGAPATVTLGPGEPNSPSLLVVLEVNGNPCACPLFGVTPLDANGWRVMHTTVPAGLSGITYSLQGITVDAAGELHATALETVHVP